tara:strand:+ start:458 stop:829 length:372 start_codon:yes stop_codon:yes gene_type:complete
MRQEVTLKTKIKVMINKQKVVDFRTDFILAVKQLEEKYGVFINLGTITYDSNELRAKMIAKVGEPVVRATKEDFNIGDVVFINHRKVSNTESFEILKINNKSVKVRSRDNNRLLTVSPSLLIK